MLQKNIWGDWIEKLLYGWLIFCVGGVGSLTYFDGFLPGHEHGEHPYHVSIFEESTHSHHPRSPQYNTLTYYIRFRLNPRTLLIGEAQNQIPGFSRIFASGLSDGYILITIRPKIFVPPIFGPVTYAAVTRQSAWIAPPEKPPSVDFC